MIPSRRRWYLYLFINTGVKIPDVDATLRVELLPEITIVPTSVDVDIVIIHVTIVDRSLVV